MFYYPGLSDGRAWHPSLQPVHHNTHIPFWGRSPWGPLLVHTPVQVGRRRSEKTASRLRELRLSFLGFFTQIPDWRL